ncbi:Hypothetical protein, putative [Bodo saltans]|uniref:Membrane-associated protein n=1 Tax=Bodo saltans TaxID=75058 RepID=A0A0S4JEV2_BODSA|nr:Hypothetical protein, putative [Bodo saltans]|eukprot:CUG87953.1 Hypothetical protein, putative [Bodo saltans]
MSFISTMALLLIAFAVISCTGQSFAGSFCGTTANNVLTLNFTFPNPSGYFGNATFSMIDFQSETFPGCPAEEYQYTPANSVTTSTPVPLGQITFASMTTTTGCMATQLQLMWITGFTITALGATYNASEAESMIFQAGAYSMPLNRC